MVSCPSSRVSGPVLWPEKGLASPHLSALRSGLLGKRLSLASGLSPFPLFCPPFRLWAPPWVPDPFARGPVAGGHLHGRHSGGHVGQEGKSLDPMSATLAFQILLLSRDRHRWDPHCPLCLLHGPCSAFWGSSLHPSSLPSLIWECLRGWACLLPGSLSPAVPSFHLTFGQSPGV